MSRGGRSTKIHAAVDALGNPIAILLITGNTPDITVAEKLISQIDFKGSTILADRAYGKWEFREFIANHDADFCIPPRKDNTDPWFVDWWLYKERHLVESFFLKLKEFRSSSSRSSEELPLASINSLPASSPSSIWLAFVFFLHNPCGYAFRNTL